MRGFVTRIVSSIVILACSVVATSVAAQTFQVIHSFTGGNDGSNPAAGVTIDRAGNLYGTASEGGQSGYGTVYKLSLRGGWVLTPLYEFRGVDYGDGAYPLARVVFGPDGSLYGTTVNGGEVGSCSGSCGTVFNLTPPPHASGSIFTPWNSTILYRFQGGDGEDPTPGDLVFDSAGSIYGTTSRGGDLGCDAPLGCGTVYRLVRSNHGWALTTLYTFHFALGGQQPMGGVLFDGSGNLYGTTSTSGMYDSGTVFKLAPSQSQWELTTIYAFTDGADGRDPESGLLIDGSGNLYGTTTAGGSGGAGTGFEIMPSGDNFSLLYSFVGNALGPAASLTMDSAGNLYGTTYAAGPYDYGTVFKLTPSSNGWKYTLLHAFTGGADGAMPLGQLAIDSNGNLYGTTIRGGANSGCFFGGTCGVVFEITP